MEEKIITKEMNIMEIIRTKPESIAVFQAFGMGCIGCLAAHSENLEQAAQVHQINVDELVDALNKA